ncbi:queuosine-tRNA galactosyltransferase isoform X2 [Amia ocellicauda]|uniref:queuosine-tRNA galactosyltransferase isoform X2 n=1 Tax=Amia ocellicauda TaxID=2972642 RepID=UPI003463C0B9
MDSNPEAPERGGPPGGPVPGKRLCVPQERPGSPGDLRSEERSSSAVDVSIILPVHNAACWLDDSLGSVLEQDFQGSMELSVFNDASQDDSLAVIERWTVRLQRRGIPTVLSGHRSPQPRGVGYAKNQAVAQSQGRYLCFLDADDIMSPQRVSLQHHAALQHPDCIVGCQVRRLPEGSTERYTRWINSLTQEQLLTQVYTSHGPTVIMPTWFCGRSWFEHVGKFDEGGRGVPEDLLFFYASLRRGVGLLRLDHCLLTYRHHPQAASLAVHEETIWSLRVGFLQERVLSQWDSFTIWNAGKQGRKLYRSLSPACRSKVVAFCDIDEKKIEKGYYTYEDSERPKPRIPVRHFRDASPPFIICVKLDMTGGDLEENLHSLNLKEGLDYFHFN